MLKADDGKIEITIVRDGINGNLFDKKNDPIIEFIVKDNGIGFNEKNLKSFQTLDSEHKLSKGCHGIGRLLWLKIFSRVEVESVFRFNGKLQKITFKFNEKVGDHNLEILDIDDCKDISTTIKLKDLSEEYRRHIPKEAETISRYILEHLLSYFISGNAPKIIVLDGNDVYDLDDAYDKYINTDSLPVKINISGHDFTVIHGKIRGKIKTSNQYSLLASNRLVTEKNITSKMMTGIPKILSDENGEFTYACYVQSEYLDQNVNSERTDFILSSFNNDVAEGEFSLNDIESAVLKSGEVFLNDYIITCQKKAKERIEKFIEEKQPKYRSILKYLTDVDYQDCVSANENELELLLHKAYQRIEEDIIQATQHELKYKENETNDEFNRRNKELLDKITDIKKSDLASYVIRRKQVLDYLEQSIASNGDGRYNREKVIHELIIPMGVESDDLAEDESNLWLIDERLAFHNYLVSDKKISSMPICPENDSGKEPDVLSLKIFNNPVLINNDSSVALASISVVEFKRPMRDDMTEGEEKNPIEQALLYIKRIRSGTVKTKGGRLKNLYQKRIEPLPR